MANANVANEHTIAAQDAAALHCAAEQAFQDSRSRVISYLVKLNHALDKNLNDLSHAILSRFCDTLVDYLSAGHFQIFQRLVPSAATYAAIESTTEQAMAFNDRFGNLQRIEIDTVKQALEVLAQVLGTRFELEDGLLSEHAAETA